MRAPRSPLLPPKDVPPERLFRLLASPQRPTLPIGYRVRGAEGIELSVVAPTALELAQALDQDNASPNLTHAQERALIALVLWAGGERAFCAPGAVGELQQREIDRLTLEVWEALTTVAPSAQWSEWRAWHATLKRGVIQDRVNYGIAVAMCDTQDAVPRFHGKPILLDRPARYYGRATCDLTEGQRWAYRAACEAVEKHHG